VDDAYTRYVIPAPGMIFHQAALWIGSWVDTRARKQPLLFTGGTEDRLASTYLAKAAFRSQSKSAARTDYIEFEGRSHFLCAEPGWEEVAAQIADWLRRAEVWSSEFEAVAA
jgi:pimeloyl-ACP methyl ester carboxylesterase